MRQAGAFPVRRALVGLYPKGCPEFGTSRKITSPLRCSGTRATMRSTRSPCGSTSTSPSPASISERTSRSSRVDLPVPVFPMTYMCESRSDCLMPKTRRSLRAFVRAKYVMRLGLRSMPPIFGSERPGDRRKKVNLPMLLILGSDDARQSPIRYIGLRTRWKRTAYLRSPALPRESSPRLTRLVTPNCTFYFCKVHKRGFHVDLTLSLPRASVVNSMGERKGMTC